ncbi:FAD dependent oxidoreductase [Mycena amicta]|nr:FAD dependent oxidoreductase [Mycena amicta]
MGGAPVIIVEEAPQPGFPLPRPSISFWLQGTRSSPLIGHRTTPTLPDDVQDVTIIGGGLTGAATAYFLLTSANPPKKVTLLEAREVSDGATGRNGGHCRPNAYVSYAGFKNVVGKEQALKIIANEAETLRLVAEIIEKEQIDCDFHRCFTYDVANTPAEAALLADVYDTFVADGGPVDGIVERFPTPESAAAETGCPSATAAYKFPASTLWPYKLVAHLVKVCLEKGMNLQTWTPVRSTTATETGVDGWEVHTDRGVVRTKKVVYATNAYTGTLLPEFAGPIYPFKGQVSAVVPTVAYSGSKNMFKNSYGFVLGDYFMQRPSDGILIIGGGRRLVDEKLLRTTDDSTVLEDITKSQKAVVRTLFGEEKWGKEAVGEGWLTSWTGIMGYSRDALPYVGALPDKPGAFICAGHHGHGMSRIMTCAKGLAAVVQGASYASTGLPECFLPTAERLAPPSSRAG